MEELVNAAKDSIRGDYGEEAARLKLSLLLEELELPEKQTEELEGKIAEMLHKPLPENKEKSAAAKKQAFIVVSKKILTLIHTLAKKKENYDPEKVFGYVRREQLKAAV